MEPNKSVNWSRCCAAVSTAALLLVQPLLIAGLTKPGQAQAQPVRLGPTVPTRSHLDVRPTLTDVPFADRRVAGALVARPLPPKTFDVPIDGKNFSATQIVVKFHEGSGVRVRDGAWVMQDAFAPIDAPLLARQQLAPASARDALAAANQTVHSVSGATSVPLFVLSEQQLSDLKSKGEAAGGKELADLNLFSFVVLPKPDPDAARKIIAQLAENPLIEQVYSQPIPRDADDIPPPTLINLRGMQHYESAAPRGIDVDFARRFPGGRGEYARIIDVEAGWNIDHEDLPGGRAVFSAHGINFGGNHGTAVAGVLWGLDNSFGVTGIAPRSGVGWSSEVAAQFPNPFYSTASAIINAAADLAGGDVILIESQDPPFLTGAQLPACTCTGDQCGYLPVEVFGAEFGAIAIATANGITVVEAAGNGQFNLDTLAAFNPATLVDSGAIMVGANRGGGDDLSPACFSNNGARVNVSAWGQLVATTGYGNQDGAEGVPPDPFFAANGTDPLQWYTAGFGGTSSASAIVAGAIGLIQSVRAAAGLPKLTPLAMRTLLTSTGTLQGAGAHIGSQPDLQAALRATLPDRVRDSKLSLSARTTPTQAITGIVSFVNDGPLEWVCDWSGSTPPHKMQCSWEGGGSDVNVTNCSGNYSFGERASATWSTTTPSTMGAHTMRCDMMAGAQSGAFTSIGAVTGSTLVAQAGQFGAAIVSFTLPATMPYGDNGNNAQPRIVPVTIKNSGTIDWDTSILNQLALRVSGGLVLGSEDIPLTTPVVAGASVTINVTFVCDSPGQKAVTAQMTMGGVPFGSSRQSSTKCLGVTHNPPPT